jgi:carbamoyl-phosphate synthase large subunit
VSRSSALASKATGYPIAKVGAKIALGYNLDEIKNAVTGKTFACFEPTIDYVVLKFPRWPFDKFFGAKRTLGTKMMATGEIMSIGKSFEAALLKGIRSLEIGQYGLERKSSTARSLDELKKRVQTPDDERLFDLAEMLRRGYRVEMVCQITGMDPFFVNKINNLVQLEEELKTMSLEDFTEESLRYFKEKGFSDKAISRFVGCTPPDIYKLRQKFDIMPVYKMVDTCAGEFEAVTPYYYSSYDMEDESVISDKKKVMVIGSGPIRIGQGIEFDYCSVHSIMALKKAGIQTIIVNNNPETVSTDFDTADKLYFEPLTEEDVLNIVERERPDGVILQFGGQTAIKLANFFDEMNIPVYGTKPEQIDAAEDREKFDAILEKLGISRPKGEGVWTVDEGVSVAERLGFPVLVRPSYVLGGQGMEITYNKEELVKYLADAFEKDSKNPVLIDRYLAGREIEVDAICDGTDVYIPGIMEHLERAGIHSGDSISIYPPQHLSEKIKSEIMDVTKKISVELKVIGMINIQFIDYNGELNIIEVNPRSSRTVPYITKVTGVPVIDIATRVMLGEKLADMGYGTGICSTPDVVAVKVPVFSTEKLPQVEVSLGPEMRSTGEVLGVGYNLHNALYKGFMAAGMTLPKPGSTIVATIRGKDHEEFVGLAKRLENLGCRFIATSGTAKAIADAGLEVKTVKKISEGVPNIIDTIRSGVVDLIVDIPKKANNKNSDGFKIRRTAVESSVTLVTSMDTFTAMVEVMEKKIEEDKLDIFDINRDMRK